MVAAILALAMRALCCGDPVEGRRKTTRIYLPAPRVIGYSRFMSSTNVTDSSRPTRWGLAAKLFTTLVLLGAIAVVVTSVLGYFRARDALEKAVFDQLTAARQTKARQVETYFRTIHAELRLLATSKMVVDATREFRIAVDQLDRAGTSPELREEGQPIGTPRTSFPDDETSG